MQHSTYRPKQIAALLFAATHPLGELSHSAQGLKEAGVTFGHHMIEGTGPQESEWLTDHGWTEAQNLYAQTGLEVPGRLGQADRLRADMIDEERRMEDRCRGYSLAFLAFGLLCVDNAIKYPTSERDPWHRLETRLERSVRSRLLNEAVKPLNGGVDVWSGGCADVARELIAQAVIHLDDENEARSLAGDADMPEAVERRRVHRR